jgi:hypothetical protein
VLPIISEIRDAGAKTLREIATALNARGVTTPRGAVARTRQDQERPCQERKTGATSPEISACVGNIGLVRN